MANGTRGGKVLKLAKKPARANPANRTAQPTTASKDRIKTARCRPGVQFVLASALRNPLNTQTNVPATNSKNNRVAIDEFFDMTTQNCAVRPIYPITKIAILRPPPGMRPDRLPNAEKTTD